MATFDIPASVTYNYLDLNNLQGMDSWDTNPSVMRASDMLNMVKKEGLHQTRHNVVQNYITGHRKFKNIVYSFVSEYDETTGECSLFVNAKLEPNTQYTISLYSQETQILILNPALFEGDNQIELTSNRSFVTVTTQASLPSDQNVMNKGWLIAYTKGEETSIKVGISEGAIIKPLSKIYFNFPDDFHTQYNTDTSYILFKLSNGYYIVANNKRINSRMADFTVKDIDDKLIYQYKNNNLLNCPSNGTVVSDNGFSKVFNSNYSFTGNINVDVAYTIPNDSSNNFNVQLTYYLTSKTNNGISYKLNEGSQVVVKIMNGAEILLTDTLDLTDTNTGRTNYVYNRKSFEITDEITDLKVVAECVINADFLDENFTHNFNAVEIAIPPKSSDPVIINNQGEYILNNTNALTVDLVTPLFNVNEYVTYEYNNIKNEYSKVQIETGSEMTDFFDSYIEGDDILYDIKYVGKIEEYDDNGNPIPYYIKISEYLGELNKENDSELVISVWASPLVKNIKYDLTQEQGFEKYKISYKRFPFTNYGKSGNRQGLYEHIEFDGKERVFTPIGILSFNCSTTETEDGFHQLNFEVENVLDNPYVPTIGYGSRPDGLDYSTYEAINLLTNRRKFQFLADGTSTKYQLPELNVEDYIKIKVLQDNGTFSELQSGFTLDKAKGVITFTTAPTKSPIDGQDNVIVEYEKKPTSALEANNFALTTISNDNLLRADINVSKSADINDNSKIIAQLETKISGASAFDKSVYTIDNTSLKVVAGNINVYNIELTDEQLTTINNGEILTINEELTFNNDGAIENRKWTSSMNVDYTKNTYKQTTTNVAGSKESDKSIDTQKKTGLGFSWIGLEYNAKAVANVGVKEDGSDSYWDVYVWVRLWLSKANYLNTRASSLYGVVDGERVYAGSTGSMYGSSTRYPSEGLTIKKKVPYSSGKQSVSIGAYLAFGSTTNLSGTNYNEMSVSTTELSLPKINLPKTITTTSGEKTTGSTTGSSSFDESIASLKDSVVKYENVVPGSARLACYYGAKCVTVYGYESDRRVFLSDGSNCDTYSGATLDGSSSISYFPDTNYRVLGEDTEIIGYAQKDGYLFTFKRGDDSVYVRYGTTLNDVTEFPSAVVTRNLQVLARPIQINDEILLITREGIKGMSYISHECRTELRSYFISNYFKLSADYDYDKMQWFKDDALLHIFLNEYEFTADLVSKSYVQEGTATTGGRYTSTLAFQYEWYISKIDWLGNQPPCVSVYQPKDFERQEKGIVYEYQREIGYNNKGVFEFSYNDYKVDKLMKIENDELSVVYKPIKAHYITPFLNMGAINVAKTVKYVYINTMSNNRDMFAIGYIDENGYQETLQKVYNDIKDYKTKHKNSEIAFPKLIQIKSKIRKFMNIKMYIQNKAELDNVDVITPDNESLYANTTFDRILIQYQIAGKYRGE